MTQLSGLLEEFLEECEDILSDLEDALLILETQPDNRAQVDRVFRGFHTIKGGAGIVELGELGEYAHVVESL
ncbi:MAG: Hpt domain-containing protein, partial [SAR324 cluster bacterium]|nr:Hpt domain-containing protein [SAR324 cluster bacterium]